VSNVYQPNVKPLDQRNGELTRATMESWLRDEAGRRGVMDLVYDVCGIKWPRVDHTRKEGSAQFSLAATLDGMATVGAKVELAGWTHCPALWRKAETERLARIEQAASRGENHQATTEESNDR